MTNHVGNVLASEIEITLDAFLGGALEVHQPRKGYRAGLDAVLLAASVPATGEGLRLLDVGAGVGVVGLCVAKRLATADVTLVEQSPALCELATQNIAENTLGKRARVIERDIAAPQTSAQPFLADNNFDVVVANPPFYDVASHRQSPHALKAASHAMPNAGLDTWLRFMARKCKSGGTAIMIHRADHLPAMIDAFSARFGALTLLPLYPRAGEPASRALLRGIKGSRAPMTIASGICLHGPGNGFTPELDAVLKTPKALNWLDTP